jgi:beta-1,4-mannosyl-glycoprotein beta-1,4-N-acetylglucosaminyltransferase
MKIVDCFIFYNELDLLNYRLSILNKAVDYFVIVESTHTHTGKQKELYYNNNKHMFEFFEDKIIHIIVDDFPHKFPNINYEQPNINGKIGEQWFNEAFQRNAIERGLKKINLHDNDFIIVSDADEIPDPVTLELIKQSNTPQLIAEINILQMDMYYYNLNSLIVNPWPYVKFISYNYYKTIPVSLTELRYMQNLPTIQKGGWHLSYFGDSTFIKNKISAFTHQELNKEHFTNIEKIEYSIKNSFDLFDRGDENKIIKLAIKDNLYLPYKYDKYLKNFISSEQ